MMSRLRARTKEDTNIMVGASLTYVSDDNKIRGWTRGKVNRIRCVS